MADIYRVVILGDCNRDKFSKRVVVMTQQAVNSPMVNSRDRVLGSYNSQQEAERAANQVACSRNISR